MKSILFKPDMIKAIAEGRKTQTRRVIKPQPPAYCDTAELLKTGAWNFYMKVDPDFHAYLRGKPRYQAGETVYIKEAFWEDSGDIYYKADCPTMPTNMFYEKGKWKSPLFMLAWAARYFIRITDVRVERLQEITATECIAEGIDGQGMLDPYIKNDFHILWDSINKPPYDWASNPWVWRYEFGLLPQSIDSEG